MGCPQGRWGSGGGEVYEVALGQARGRALWLQGQGENATPIPGSALTRARPPCSIKLMHAPLAPIGPRPTADCSKECQRQHWRVHMQECRQVSASGAGTSAQGQASSAHD